MLYKNISYTVGIPWTWIGVGFFMCLTSKPARMPLWSFMSLNDRNGGGISTPSTKILNSFLNFSCLLSGIPKIYRGGFQLQSYSNYFQLLSSISNNYSAHSLKIGNSSRSEHDYNNLKYSEKKRWKCLLRNLAMGKRLQIHTKRISLIFLHTGL